MTPLENALRQISIKGSTVLDLCCGDGRLFQGRDYSFIQGVDVFDPYLEIYTQNLERSRASKYDLNYVSTSVDSLFADNSWDFVFCLDGVEHLEQKPGQALIERMESIAKVAVVIFTPVNVLNPEIPVLNEPVEAFGINGGQEFQKHRSAHSPSWFSERHYDCYELCRTKNVYDGTMYREMLYIRAVK